MIDAQALLRDLKRMVRDLEKDLREAHANSAAGRGIEAEWREAHDAGRTAHSLETFLGDALTQAAVHWILACVFLRFIEDNGLVDRPWLAGPGERLALARDRQAAYFSRNPRDSDVDYLLACFDEAAGLPGLAGLLDRGHNPLFRLPVSGDGAMALLGFLRKEDPDTGLLVHDFTDAAWSTRFLGDLYQDLSEAARKRYALLQTPEFVERFILERTFDPALNEFGLKEVRLIDPACGSGHFLLGAFERLCGLWLEREPGLNPRAAAQRALDAVAGVDINPFAAEIARFRLLLAALKASDIPRLKEAPAFKIHVAVGDSLLHGVRFGRLDLGDDEYPDNRLARLRAHRYASEDNGALTEILSKPYHAVVANPPYITPKDPAENAAYRVLYHSCHMKYALAVPFIERCFDLALDGRLEEAGGAGFVGLIVANSFMKREFGKKLIEDFLPLVDLTHVVDTAGAYIPGHGTPTAILFGRNRRWVEHTVRAVMGIKGEPAPPDDPAKGLVWSAIRAQVDEAGSESEFVSVADTPRETFRKHPWSIGGGGAAELKELIESTASGELGNACAAIGYASFPGLDDAFIALASALRRKGIEEHAIKPIIYGEAVKDWRVNSEVDALVPYTDAFNLISLDRQTTLWRFLWPNRTLLGRTVSFGGKTKAELGHAWWGWYRWLSDRYSIPYSITFAFVATHNHFVLDRGGKAFKQTAPVIKLGSKASEKDHLALLGLLNSSTACFWAKQVFQNRGSTVDDRGARQRTAPFEDFYEFTGTGLESFPLAKEPPTDLARKLDRLSIELGNSLPAAVVARTVPMRDILEAARAETESIRSRMIALQEELDWRCYRLYSLIEDTLEHPNPPPLALGERAFEIVMARRMAAGELETAWFERHGSIPITDLPSHWPADYRDFIERRIALIESHRWIGLVERPEYKRRWQWTPWAEQEHAALEDKRFWQGEPALLSTNRLADLAARDRELRQVAELYAGRSDIDLNQLVRELVEAESVPYLPVLRYTEAGLRKRQEWESTWEKQRQEDAIDAEVEARRPVFEGMAKDFVREQIKRGEERRKGENDEAYAQRIDKLLAAAGEAIARKADSLIKEAQDERKAKEVGAIPVPPKYKKNDFQGTSWGLRGGLDVPKERFVSYPGAEREADGSPVVSWAGFDHLQQAKALATYYIQCKEREGWGEERLKPLLAGLIELLPWLLQWHNAYDPDFGMGLGDYFKSFIEDEARSLDTTPEALAGWRPSAGVAGRTTRRAGRRGKRRGEAAE